MAFQGSLQKSRRRLLIGVAAASMLLAISGCGASGGDTSSDSKISSARQACVDKANEWLDARGGQLPDKLPAELTPLEAAPKAGLTITRITPGSVPTSVALSKKIIETAPVVGWTGKMVTYDGSVEDANRKALETLDNTDVLIIDGLPSAALQAVIKAATSKGVLLLLGSVTDKPESVPGFGGTPLGGDLYTKIGELAAYTILKETKCQAKIAAFGLPVEALQHQGEVIKEVLAKECEDCSASYTDIQFADVGSPAAANAVTSKLQSDPSINYAYFAIGDLAVGIRPGLKQAGREVKIGGAIPVPSNLSDLKKGENSFWIGVPQGMSAWINIDTAVRALATNTPVAGDNYPFPVFTPDNIESTDPIPVYPKDYQDEFKALWKLS